MNEKSSSAGSGLGLALVSAATFGSSGPIAKSMLEAGWSPSATLLLRTGIAAAVLLPWIFRALRRNPPQGRHIRLVVGYGLVAIAGAQGCFFNAVQYLPVGVALLLEYLAPVLLIGLAWLRTGRAPGRRTLIGTALSLLGLMLVLDIGGVVAVSLVGVAWGLGAAVCLAGYFLMSSQIPEDLPPVLLAGGGLVVGSLAIALLGLLGVQPLLAGSTEVTLLDMQMSWVVPATLMGLVSTVAAYLTGIAAAVRLGSRVASFVGLTEVLFAVFFAWLFVSQLPAPIQLVGGALVLAGVATVKSDSTEEELITPHTQPVGLARSAISAPNTKV